MLFEIFRKVYLNFSRVEKKAVLLLENGFSTAISPFIRSPHMKYRNKLCLGLAVCLTAILSGCMTDGTPYMYAGVGAGMSNMETTIGKHTKDEMSPSRHPNKTASGHNAGMYNQSGPFTRHEP